MLQADIGRVNARAGEERRIVPQRDEKILIYVAGVIVGVTLRPSHSVPGADDLDQSICRVDVLNLPSAMIAHNLPVVV
jgi:hypothetical protein